MYVMALQSLSFSNMWHSHAKDVATCWDATWWGWGPCKEILLLPTSLILGKCSSLGKGPGYKDSLFLLTRNTVKVPWYFVSYEVLLLGKERGQDLNASN